MILDWIFHKCRDSRIEDRWVSINGPESNGKKNHPPEELLEVKRFCNECGAETARAYFTKEQVAEWEKKQCRSTQT